MVAPEAAMLEKAALIFAVDNPVSPMGVGTASNQALMNMVDPVASVWWQGSLNDSVSGTVQGKSLFKSLDETRWCGARGSRGCCRT